MKIKILLLTTLISVSIYSQNISYGFLLKGNFYTLFSNNSRNSFSQKENEFFKLNYGLYLEYGFNNKISVKLEASTNKRNTIYYQNNYPYPNKTYHYNLQYFDIIPSFKYNHRNNKHKKGVYVMLGTRFSFKTKLDNEFLSDNFQNLVIGEQLSLGTKIFNMASIEMKLDVDVTPFVKFKNGNNSYFANLSFALFFDLEKLINKK